MSTAVLSFGSNVGDSLAYLRGVVAGLGDEVVAVSSAYRSAPWGGVEQQDFLNAVLIARHSDPDPWSWLRTCRILESAAERVRDVRWGPRTLDVDVVSVLDDAGVPITHEDEELTLPHPRAHLRAFVLVPWLEVDADAVLPRFGAVADLVDQVRDQGLELLDGVSLR